MSERMTSGRAAAGLVLALGLSLAGCGDSGTAAGEGGATDAMPAPAQASVVHSAAGTLNSVDRSAGTANISHEAVPSAQWPAMTMNFHLPEAVTIEDVEPGQHIRFEFTTDDGGTVTKIEVMH